MCCFATFRSRKARSMWCSRKIAFVPAASQSRSTALSDSWTACVSASRASALRIGASAAPDEAAAHAASTASNRNARAARPLAPPSPVGHGAERASDHRVRIASECVSQLGLQHGGHGSDGRAPMRDRGFGATPSVSEPVGHEHGAQECRVLEQCQDADGPPSGVRCSHPPSLPCHPTPPLTGELWACSPPSRVICSARPAAVAL